MALRKKDHRNMKLKSTNQIKSPGETSRKVMLSKETSFTRFHALFCSIVHLLEVTSINIRYLCHHASCPWSPSTSIVTPSPPITRSCLFSGASLRLTLEASPASRPRGALGPWGALATAAANFNRMPVRRAGAQVGGQARAGWGELCLLLGEDGVCISFSFCYLPSPPLLTAAQIQLSAFHSPHVHLHRGELREAVLRSLLRQLRQQTLQLLSGVDVARVISATLTAAGRGATRLVLREEMAGASNRHFKQVTLRAKGLNWHGMHSPVLVKNGHKLMMQSIRLAHTTLAAAGTRDLPCEASSSARGMHTFSQGP